MIRLYNADCLEAMKAMPDKAYQLAIVDPPYGVKIFRGGYAGRLAKYGQMITVNDMVPTSEYFQELFRVSDNQIIWGGNYFTLPNKPSWIVWDKQKNRGGAHAHFGDGELAWTSFDRTLKILRLRYDGFIGADSDGRISPTQKPVKLYEWLLRNYATLGANILDTHIGSGSIAIACHNMGYSLDGFEIDTDYYNAAVKRLDNHKRQGLLFTPQEVFKDNLG